MTDDIVARLRKGTRTPYGLAVQSDEARLHSEAADEIERLRKCIKSISDASMFPEDAFQKAVHELCDAALKGDNHD